MGSTPASVLILWLDRQMTGRERGRGLSLGSPSRFALLDLYAKPVHFPRLSSVYFIFLDRISIIVSLFLGIKKD